MKKRLERFEGLMWTHGKLQSMCSCFSVSQHWIRISISQFRRNWRCRTVKLVRLWWSTDGPRRLQLL